MVSAFARLELCTNKLYDNGRFSVPLRHRNNTSETEEVPDEVEELERRLDSIMTRLRGIQAQVDKLKGGRASGVTMKQVENLTLVIEADPKYPPLSLQQLVRLLILDGSVRTSLTVHGHSTLPASLPAHLVSWFGSWTPPNRSRMENQLNLTWIWKPVGCDPTAKIVNLSCSDLQGQASIARLLARLIESWTQTPFYESFGSSTSAQIDEWIDQLELGCGSGLSVPPSLSKRIEARLGKADWLAGPGRGAKSFADVFLSSLLKSQLTSPKAKDWCTRSSG